MKPDATTTTYIDLLTLLYRRIYYLNKYFESGHQQKVCSPIYIEEDEENEETFVEGKNKLTVTHNPVLALLNCHNFGRWGQLSMLPTGRAERSAMSFH